MGKKPVFKRYSYFGMALQVVTVSTLNLTRYIPLSMDKKKGFHSVDSKTLGMRETREEAQADLDAFAKLKKLKEVQI